MSAFGIADVKAYLGLQKRSGKRNPVYVQRLVSKAPLIYLQLQGLL